MRRKQSVTSVSWQKKRTRAKDREQIRPRLFPRVKAVSEGQGLGGVLVTCLFCSPGLGGTHSRHLHAESGGIATSPRLLLRHRT